MPRLAHLIAHACACLCSTHCSRLPHQLLSPSPAEAYLTEGAGAQHNMSYAMAKTPCRDVFAQSLACYQDAKAHEDDTGECLDLGMDMGMCLSDNHKDIAASSYFDESVRRAEQARARA